MPTLHLAASLLAEIDALCEREHPREACGFLLGRLVPREGKGPKVVATRVHPARNVGGLPAHRYEASPEDVVAADTMARSEGLEVLGVYHSHPEAGDGPSEQDRAGAQPGWAYLIVSVRRGAEGAPAQTVSRRCWQLHGNDLVEQPLCVC